MRHWLPYRARFLSEMIRFYGRGGAEQATCLECNVSGSAPLFRCKDCFSVDMVCASCMVKRHEANPLHIIQVYYLALHSTPASKTFHSSVGLARFSNVHR